MKRGSHLSETLPLPENLNSKAFPPFAALRAFEAFGRFGGVRRAAQALMLDHAVVSRHLRALEAWTGRALIARRPGAQQLTKDGERYYHRLSAAMAELADATSEFMRGEQDRRLVVWSAPGLAAEWLSDKLWQFQQTLPNLDLELRSTDAYPDFSRYEADIDIRYLREPRPLAEGVRQMELARPPVIAAASPECLAAMLPVRNPADLLKAPLLHEESFGRWRSWFAHYDVDAPNLSGPRLWHAHLTLEAARKGRGVALADAFLVGDDLATGRLINVGRQFGRAAILGGYVLSARIDRWEAPALAHLRDWLAREAAEDLALEAA
jgi:LysR family transcriptional regulator, glycine cleavage system transcriptional activator